MSATEASVMEFVFKAVGDVGGVLNGAMVVIGDRLGLYRAMAGQAPMTAKELATKTETSERYIREWLCAQAARGYIKHEGGDRFSLPEEHAIALTHEMSPAFVSGAFETALGAVRATDRIAEAFRSGDGMPWRDHHSDVHEGCERFFRPGYLANLVTEWIPKLEGVAAKLTQGANVADIGCGHGASTIAMAKAFPRSRFVGIDAHPASIDVARQRAAEAGVADRVTFKVSTAKELGGRFDLIAFFDCLHDMGDPAGALKHMRTLLDEGGTVMLVEPNAADSVDGNLNPIGAAYYGFSTLLCTPSSLSQEVQTALGAQAGEARLREVAKNGGFTKVRRVAETPFNMVLELKA